MGFENYRHTRAVLKVTCGDEDITAFVADVNIGAYASQKMNEKFQIRETLVEGRKNFTLGNRSAFRQMLRVFKVPNGQPLVDIVENTDDLRGNMSNAAIWLLPGYARAMSEGQTFEAVSLAVRRFDAIICVTPENFAEIALEFLYSDLNRLIGDPDHSFAEGYGEMRHKIISAIREQKK